MAPVEIPITEKRDELIEHPLYEDLSSEGYVVQ